MTPWRSDRIFSEWGDRVAVLRQKTVLPFWKPAR